MPEAVAAPAAPVATPTPAAGRAPPSGEEPREEGKGAAEPAKPQEPPRKWKIKGSKGEEEEVDEQKLLHLATKGKGAARYFEEGRKAREEAAAEAKKWEALKTGDANAKRAALRELLTPEEFRKLSEAELYEAMEAEQLTPEQKRIRELEAQLGKHTETEKQRQAREQEEALERQAEELRESIGTAATGALTELGLPKESQAWLVRRMAPYLARNLEAENPLDTKEIAAMVVEEKEAEDRAFYGKLDGEGIIARLGEELAVKVSKAFLARKRAGTFQPAAPKPPEVRAEPKPESRLGRWEQINQLIDGK